MLDGTEGNDKRMVASIYESRIRVDGSGYMYVVVDKRRWRFDCTLVHWGRRVFCGCF